MKTKEALSKISEWLLLSPSSGSRRSLEVGGPIIGFGKGNISITAKVGKADYASGDGDDLTDALKALASEL